jgi:WD40 repeat protein
MATRSKPQFNPFPGLRPFGIEEDYLFFGREEQVTELLGLLREHRFLTVVGTSGSGKSSLVRAGLLPALHGGTLTGPGSSWEVLLLRPGGDPITNLASNFVEADLYDGEDEESLLRVKATLTRSRTGLVEAVKQSDLPTDTNLLVVVDQFEELFRYRDSGVSGQEGATAFVKLLLAAANQQEQPIYIAITMRSDYLGDCAQIPGLAEAVNDGEYLIPRLSRKQRRAAIEKPAHVGGGEIAAPLVHKLLNEVGDDADQLPILQHALMRIWDHWAADGNTDQLISLSHYQQVGGLSEALSQHADEVYAALPDDRHRLIARKLFQAITERGPDNRGIRRPTSFNRLCEIVGGEPEEVTLGIDAFRRAGRTFLMPPEGVELTPETVIDISHESLMRVWRQLREWVEQESQSARIYLRLSESAALHEQQRAGLYRDPELGIALAWREETRPNQAWAERYRPGFESTIAFLEASQQASVAEEQTREAARQRELEQAKKLADAERLRAEEQQRSAHRLKGLVAALGVVAVLAGLAFVGAMVARHQAGQNARRASEAEARALQEASEAKAARQRAVQASEQAVAAQQDAERQRERARRGMYISQINMARRLLDVSGGSESIDELLGELRPDRGETDLRDWEWYYLNTPQRVSGTVIESGRWLLCVDFNPLNSDQIVFGGQGGGLVVHDLKSKRDLFPLVGHQLFAFDVAWSPDGRLIASGSEDQTVRIWDAETGIELHTLRGHTGTTVVNWSPDSKRLVTGSKNEVCIWDVASGQLIAQPRGVKNTCALSPDGQRIVYQDDSRTAKIWDIDSGAVGVTFDGHESLIKDYDWSPDGTRVVSCDENGKVMIWDAMSGEQFGPPLSGHTDRVWRVRWSPDGASIATASDDHTARIFDASTGESLHVLKAHFNSVYGLAWKPQGGVVATASTDSRVILWNVRKQDVSEQTLDAHRDAVQSIAWSPDGTRMASVGKDDKTVAVWDAASGKKIYEYFEHSDPVVALDWSGDGKWIASAENGAIHLWEANTDLKRPVHTLKAGSIRALDWDPRDLRLAAAAGNRVLIWDLRDLDHPIQEPPLTGHRRVNSVVWSPDGKQLASAGQERRWGSAESPPTIRIWDADSGRLSSTLSGDPQIIDSLAWSPNGRWIASAGNLADSMAVSQDVWDVINGQQIATMRGHSAAIDGMQWNKDSSRLISSSSDGTASVWDPLSGRELLALPLPDESQASAAAWSPDGMQIATGDRSGKIRFFDASPGYRRERSELLLGELDRQVDAGMATAEDLILRGQIHSFAGRWKLAEVDFLAADALREPEQDSPAWYRTPWWVLGPFDPDDEDSPPADAVGNPFSELAHNKAGTNSATEAQWRPAFIGDRNLLNFREYFQPVDDVFCYAFTRFYSPREQTVGLLLGSDDTHRVWLNNTDRWVHEDTENGGSAAAESATLVKLQPGWNTVLAKVTNVWGAYHLYLRLSTNPLDLANAYEQSKDWEEAVQQWDLAIASDPDDVALLVRRSQAAINAGLVNQAINDLTELIEKIPNNTSLVLQRLKLLGQLGRWDEVAADYHRLVAIRPDDWELRLDIGRMYARLGETIMVPPTSTWRWLHPADGVDPATVDPDFHRSFFAIDFDDSGWRIGQDSPGSKGGFGFGDPASVDIGDPPANQRTTAYFRHRFTIDEEYDRLSISLRRDDGVIIYLDGVEVGRSNIERAQQESFQLAAPTSSNRREVRRIGVAGRLQPGEHVLAISLHNRRGSSDDLFLGEISFQGLAAGHKTTVALEHPAEYFGRGAVYAEVGWIDLADADFDAGLKLGSEGDDTEERLTAELVRIAENFSDQWDLKTAVQFLGRVLVARPDSADLLLKRGQILGRSGQWQLAAADLSKAVELDPENILSSYYLSFLLMQTGQHERYREHCGEMIKQFRDDSPANLGKAVIGCYWAPDAVDDWNELENLVDRSTQVSSWLLPYRLMTKGVYFYRAGRFKDAIDWIPQEFDEVRDSTKGYGSVVLAMAYHQDGQTTKATEILQEAETMLTSAFEDLQAGGDLGNDWHDWLAMRLLFREAVGLIRGQAGASRLEAEELTAEGRPDEAEGNAADDATAE